MQFRISDTFTDSLAKLTGDEQKAAKTTAFDLQLNPANPGLQFHRLDGCKDKNFWSVRVNRDIRVIVHKTAAGLLLCYVDHHEKAYRWAEKRRLEKHPKTGAAQLVEIRETVREIEIPTYVESASPMPPCLAGVVREDLLNYGVPDQWVDDCLAADEDGLLAIADRLPAEAAEALLTLATGGKPEPAVVAADSADPFEHPDALRRFRVLDNAEELAVALESPWEKWTTFLHPSQRDWVDKRFNGPARVSGSAGTGKTIVAIHRAAAAARNPVYRRILLTTFSDDLAKALRQKLTLLIPKEWVCSKLENRGEDSDSHNGRGDGSGWDYDVVPPASLAEVLQDDSGRAERPGPEGSHPTIVVAAINTIALQLYAQRLGDPHLIDDGRLLEKLEDLVRTSPAVSLSPRFLFDEWNDVVDGRNLQSWEEYRDAKRLGRKTRLGESGRRQAWQVFEGLRLELERDGLVTLPMVFAKLSELEHRCFDAVVVDECQDLNPAQLRFLASLTSRSAGGLFFAGDLGQRIFQTPFSWASLGIDIRGRSRTLKINYRTSHQIRRQADRLLDGTLTDVDGNEEHRDGTISVFNGPVPTIHAADSEDAETDYVADWLLERIGEGVVAQEIGVFARTEAQLARAREAVKKASDISGTGLGGITLTTMHAAKGLEFRTVCVIACDDNVIPLEERIASIGDQADLEDLYNTERHLLYVACTRARDHLLVTGVDPVSEFLGDFAGNECRR